MQSRRFKLSWLVLPCATLLVTPAFAVHVRATNYADELAGGRITVHYSAIFGDPGGQVALETGHVTYILLGNSLTHTAMAPADPNFTFSVTGETFSATWELVNITAPAADPFAGYISKVEIDLRSSVGGVLPSLFDNDSDPSTPNSGAGVLGIVPLGGTGPAPSSAVESDTTWPPSLVNFGDMYGKETLTWAGLSMLGPGQSFLWHDDTDRVVIPEPSSLTMLTLVGIALLGARLHSRHSGLVSD